MEDEKPIQVLGEQTRFTFAILIAALGLATWLTKMSFQNDANAQAIKDIKESQFSRDEKIEQMATDLAVIKSEVHQIRRRIK